MAKIQRKNINLKSTPSIEFNIPDISNFSCYAGNLTATFDLICQRNVPEFENDWEKTQGIFYKHV